MLRRPLLLIFLLALALRLAVVIATADLPIGLDDMFQYDMLARSIAAGNGYRWYAQEDLALIQRYIHMEVPPEYDPRGVLTSFRPPLYPAFLALVYLVVGTGAHRLFAARLVQALLGASLAPLTGLLARRLGFGERAVRWSATAIAVYPLLVIYPLALATENLYVPLLALSLCVLLRAGETGRTREFVLAGLLLGFAALTRSVVTFFVPIAAMWAMIRRWGGERAGSPLRNGVVLVLCFLVVTIPWSVRNTLLHGEFTFIESALGYDLYVGYHPLSTGTFTYEVSRDLLPILDDGERNRQGMEAFWSFVRADPGRVLYLMARKFGHFWALDRRAFQYFYSGGFFGQWPSWMVGGALALLCAPLLLIAPSGLAGAALTRPRRATVLVGLFLIYYVGIHMLILAEDRFHVPLLPLLSALSAYTLLERPWRQAARWQKVVAVVLVLALLATWGCELVRDHELLLALLGPEGSQLRLNY